MCTSLCRRYEGELDNSLSTDVQNMSVIGSPGPALVRGTTVTVYLLDGCRPPTISLRSGVSSILSFSLVTVTCQHTHGTEQSASSTGGPLMDRDLQCS